MQSTVRSDARDPPRAGREEMPMPADFLQKPEKLNGDPRARNPHMIDHICADTTPVVLDRRGWGSGRCRGNSMAKSAGYLVNDPDRRVRAFAEASAAVN